MKLEVTLSSSCEVIDALSEVIDALCSTADSSSATVALRSGWQYACQPSPRANI